MSWILHTTKKVPVDKDTIVIVELEDGHITIPLKACDIDWYCPGDDVVRYLVIRE
jgi:hypothetical protein